MKSRETQQKKILKLFKHYGKLTNRELNKVCYRYSARMHELRKDGYVIATNRLNNQGLFEYTYLGHREDRDNGQER